jgi:hypothetical protein
MRKAFLQAVRDIVSTADMDRLTRALDTGNVTEALDALGIGPEYYRPLENAMVEIYAEGGGYQIDALPKQNPDTGTRTVFRFGVQSQRAQEWLRRESSRLIVEISEGQRNAAREAMERGLSEGRNPKAVGLDLVGRYNPKTRERSGGTIGLTSRETRAVQNYRGKRIEEGRPADQVERMTKRYASKLLRLRGERIARTETIGALNAGRMEAVQQAIDNGKIGIETVTKVWDATMDRRTRDAHAILDGDQVGFNEPFRSVTGSFLNHPGDQSLGASGKDIVNCRCTMRIKVDFLAGVE